MRDKEIALHQIAILEANPIGYAIGSFVPLCTNWLCTIVTPSTASVIESETATSN